MKIICKSNYSGKTKELIKESLDKNIPILALTLRKENSLKEKSIAYFGKVVSTINYLEAKEYDGQILIDDMEEILDFLVKEAFHNKNLSVECVTLSA